MSPQENQFTLRCHNTDHIPYIQMYKFTNDQQMSVFAPDLFRMLFRNPSRRCQSGRVRRDPRLPSTLPLFFVSFCPLYFLRNYFLSGREGGWGGGVWVGGAWSRVRANREGSFSLSLPPSTPQPLQRAEGNYRGSGKLEQRASRQRGRAGRDPGWPRRYRAQNKTESGRGKGLLSEWEGRIAYIEIDWSEIGKKQVNSVRRKNSNLIMDVKG